MGSIFDLPPVRQTQIHRFFATTVKQPKAFLGCGGAPDLQLIGVWLWVAQEDSGPANHVKVR
jgi:hypothetical protein